MKTEISCEMNCDYYFKLILDDLEGAIKYKNRFIPDTLYKFYSLDEEETSKNRSKLEALSQKQVYLSNWEELNDPFEFNTFFINRELFVEKGYIIDVVDEIINSLRERVLICSFTGASSGCNNMPMWAYYANNHKGVCVEYKIDYRLKRMMFPVFYEPNRLAANNIVSQLYNDLIRIRRKKGSSEVAERTIGLLSLYVNTKHESWMSENEYRITKLGDKESSRLFQLKPHNVFIGASCEHKEQVVEACQCACCGCYEPKINKDKIEFEFEWEKVI